MLGAEVVVVRNSSKSLKECLELNPTHIVIGPGPGTPSHAKVSNELIGLKSQTIPILGVCLGHQCIAEVFGACVVKAKSGPIHGKTSKISHTGQGVFNGLPDDFHATRYHSLAIDQKTLPRTLQVTAIADDGEIMGIRHDTLPQQGVQFHPESVLTKPGMQLLKNFIQQTNN